MCLSYVTRCPFFAYLVTYCAVVFIISGTIYIKRFIHVFAECYSPLAYEKFSLHEI